MPHEMDARNTQAQQMMMQQQQFNYSQVAAQANQHWQQPTQTMQYGQMQYVGNMEYDKNNGGFGYTPNVNIDPSELYAAQRAAAVQQQQQQQQQQQHFVYPMYQQTQAFATAGYGQMPSQVDQEQQAALRSTGVALFSRPPPAVKRSGVEADSGTSNMHSSPLSVFDNAQSSAAYTASWVSSTSSIPPEMKDSPEELHLPPYNQSQQLHMMQSTGVQSRGTVPGGEWVQPGTQTHANPTDFGTWGERRDEGGALGNATATFDHTQFARMQLDDGPHHNYSGVAGMGGGEWNAPEKNHPQQGITLQAGPWQTVVTQGQQTPQPLLLLNQQSQQHQSMQGNNQHNKGGGMFNNKPQQRQQHNNHQQMSDATPLSWEERLRKAQGAKERAEYAGARGPFGEMNTGGGGGVPPQRERRPPRGMYGGKRGDRHDGGGHGEMNQGGNTAWKAQDQHERAFPPMQPMGYGGQNAPQQQQMMRGGGVWRGGMNTGNGRGMATGTGINVIGMAMRGGANNTRGGGAPGVPPVHPMLLRGGFGMLPPGVTPQDEKFRSTWLDANMCIPALMGFPVPPVNPMLMRGGPPRGRGGMGVGGGPGRQPYNRGGGYSNRGARRDTPPERKNEGPSDEEHKEDGSTPVEAEKKEKAEETAKDKSPSPSETTSPAKEEGEH